MKNYANPKKELETTLTWDAQLKVSPTGLLYAFLWLLDKTAKLSQSVSKSVLGGLT